MTHAWPFFSHRTYTDNIDLTSRPYCGFLPKTTSFDLGPIAQSDTSAGLNAYIWRARVEGGDVYVCRADLARTAWGAEILAFVADDSESPNVPEVSITFDQNGKLVIAFTKGGKVYLWWFDPTISATRITEIAAGRNPIVYLDDRVQMFSGDSDVLLFMVQPQLDRMIYVRQRDRYETAYDMGIDHVKTKYFERVMMGTDRRLYIYYVDSPIWRSVCEQKHSKLKPMLMAIRSPVYPLWFDAVDSLDHTADAILSGILRTIWLEHTVDEDSIDHTADAVLSGIIRDIVHLYSMDEDSIDHISDEILSGILRDTIHLYTMDEDALDHVSDEILSGSIRTSILTDTVDEDSLDHVGDSILSGSLI